MWNRFTGLARNTVFFAKEEAERFGSRFVCAEHLLLGLLREETNVAGRVLRRMGISPILVRAEVERLMVRGDDPPGQDMQLTPIAFHVLELCYEERRLLNNEYIGTEHILLGLIRGGDGVVGLVLAKLGVGLEKTREEARKLQAEHSDNPNTV